VYQSEPRFIEFIDCTYIFFWETAAACEVKFRFGLDKQPGCKILSGTNGHLFDISKLNLVSRFSRYICKILNEETIRAWFEF